MTFRKRSLIVTCVTTIGESAGTQRARGTRERVLDAAERQASEVGMAKLRVGHVAALAGVSRQTVYNEFGDKFGLAEAVAVRVTDRLVDAIEVELARHPSLPEAVASGMALALRVAAQQPLVQLTLARKDDDDMIALLTTDAAAVIHAATRRLVEIGGKLWPEIAPGDHLLIADLATRMTISHLVCITESPEQAAAKLATWVKALLASRGYPR